MALAARWLHRQDPTHSRCAAAAPPRNFCAAALPARRAGSRWWRSCCSLAPLRPCSARPSGGSTSVGATFHEVNEGSAFSRRMRSNKWLRLGVPDVASAQPRWNAANLVLREVLGWRAQSRAAYGRLRSP